MNRSSVGIDDLALDQRHLVRMPQVHQPEFEMQTEQLRFAQVELKTSRDRYSALYDFAPVGYVTLSDAGVIVEANLTLTHWLGLDRADVLGHSFSDFVASGIDQDTAIHHHKTLVETGEPQSSEVHLVRPDGPGICARLESRREDRVNQSHWVQTTISDITQRKQAEEALSVEHIAHVLAEQETQLKTRLIAKVSHELRNPLSSIKGFTSTLLSDDVQLDPAQIHECLDIINQETDKLVELVEQLLNHSSLQTGELQIHAAPVSLQDIITRSTVQMQALTVHHQLVLPVIEELPLVLADSARIAQVLVNLVGNAVKFCPDNTPITLSARQIEGVVAVSVTDQGDGIAAEDRDRVFQAFEQLSTISYIKGVGLGLAICKELVEAHHGQIWIEDRAGPGTTVTFTLPVAP